jgi:hypothetical protein
MTITAGGVAVLDPADSRVISFTFEDDLADGVEISDYDLTITALKQNGAGALTIDNDALESGNRGVRMRLIATAATPGDLYEVACKRTTNETPPDIGEQSFVVKIENR